MDKEYDCETCLDDPQQCNCLVDIAPWDAWIVFEPLPHQVAPTAAHEE